MLRYNRLLSIISAALPFGESHRRLSVMSADLENVFNAFAIGQVPDLWMSKSFPSLKPLASYVEDLLARLRLFSDWYEKGQPSIFWISGFFFTPSFTTAALQNFARVNKLAIDTVDFEMEMLDMDEKQYTVAPEIGIYVYGMYLEGCAGQDGENPVRIEAEVLSSPRRASGSSPCSPRTSCPGRRTCPVYRTAARKGARHHGALHQLPHDDAHAHHAGRGPLDPARACMLCRSLTKTLCTYVRIREKTCT